MVSLVQHIQGLVAMVLDGAKPAAKEGPFAGTEKFMLWVDAVGGYRVCLGEEVVIGQPSEREKGTVPICRNGPSGALHKWGLSPFPGTGADIPILADLSSRHARIRRDGENYVIEALRDVLLDGRPVRSSGWLADGSRIELGEGVRLAFRRPHPLSATARLELVSRHRTEPPSDAVLLWAQTCILGPKAQSHVVCRDWPGEVILSRQAGRLYCHAPGVMEIDGVCVRGRGPLAGNSRVRGEGFSFSLEPIG
ncbi:MAG: FHA domain-containing protein [Thermoguttaceae bacterium]|jgi:hypothetical protein